MSEWKQKRFWTETSVIEEQGQFGVALDGRRIKTPAKASLWVPTRALAEAIAGEWDAQDDKVDPGSMPCTRSANAALDKVAVQFSEVADMISEYGDSDLLCYRADSPVELVTRQDEIWNPALDWAAAHLGARLQPRIGVLHAPQDAQALARLRADVHAQTPFQLAAFHDLVGLSGSLILGFAATQSWKDLDELWEIAHLDERWQEEQWGVDEEAREAESVKKAAFEHAARFYQMSLPQS